MPVSVAICYNRRAVCETNDAKRERQRAMESEAHGVEIDVDRVAYLARLGLSADEKERIRGQLAPILGYFETLKELNTDAILPTAQVISMANVMREDRVRPSFPAAEILQNAPQHEGEYIKVRAVFGETDGAS